MKLEETPLDENYLQKKPKLRVLTAYSDNLDMELLVGLPDLEVLSLTMGANCRNLESLGKMSRLKGLILNNHFNMYGSFLYESWEWREASKHPADQEWQARLRKDDLETRTPKALKAFKKDWPFLSKLKKLRYLQLINIPIPDSKIFADMEDLKVLILKFSYHLLGWDTEMHFPPLKEVISIGGLAKLEHLDIDGHAVQELYPLWQNKWLRFISFGGRNSISSWAPILDLPRLEEIVHGEGAKDLSKCPLTNKKTQAKCTHDLNRRVAHETWKELTEN